MVEEAVRIPVSRAELHVPQRAPRQEKRRRTADRGFRRRGALCAPVDLFLCFIKSIGFISCCIFKFWGKDAMIKYASRLFWLRKPILPPTPYAHDGV